MQFKVVKIFRKIVKNGKYSLLKTFPISYKCLKRFFPSDLRVFITFFSFAIVIRTYFGLPKKKKKKKKFWGAQS